MSRQLISAALLLALGTLSSVIVSDAAPAPEVVEASESLEDNALLNQSPVVISKATADPEVVRIVESTITAYSSEVAQTDSTPFITASGTRVREGVVAANWLPIGTRVRIPELFGEQVFIVEDRMHRRHTDRLDVWFAAKTQAVNFGVRRAQVEILQ